MKKRTLSFLLAIVLCLSLLPMTALAAGPSATAKGTTLTIDKANYQQGEKIIVSVSNMVRVTGDYAAAYDYLGEFTISKAGSEHGDNVVVGEPFDFNSDGSIEGYSLTAPTEDGSYELRLYTQSWGYLFNSDYFVVSVPFTVGNVKTGSISVAQTENTANSNIVVSYSGITDEMASANAFVGIFKPGEAHDVNKVASRDGYKQVTAGAGQVTLNTPNINGQFELRLYNTLYNLSADNLMMSISITLSGATASEWAVAELERAEELGLIPDCLEGADLTADITRAEFAAVSVKVYEALSGTAAIPVVNNPFSDTNDVEVLKAYNVGITDGVGGGKYDPNALLNREQAATMLTRVFKRVTLDGWTLKTDSQFTLPYTKPAAFADDADISSWAKDSVYFMAANKIINGVGGNKFAPKNVTTEEQATGYANATREQALLIAVRMVENLG